MSERKIIRTDTSGRDVTNLPGLWSEDDTITQASRNHHLICLPHHAPKIIDGTKTTTIRAPRKRGSNPAVGDTITFARWTGRPYRSDQERVRVVTVTSVRKISVFRNGICWDVDIDRTSPSTETLRELAIGDGFECITELVDYLTSDKQPEFSGCIYGWESQ